MKKIITILFLINLCLYTQIHAQNSPDELLKQAQENLAQKEYTKARYLFLQAYKSFASTKQYNRTTECGIKASALYHRENFYKEAFDLLRGTEQLVTTAERKDGKPLPELHFNITKERLQMYIKLKNPERAKTQLNRLEKLAKTAQNDSLTHELLYTQARYYYTFGMNTQGDATINKLIGQYKAQENYDRVNNCYQTLIEMAHKTNNAGLLAHTYEQYISWTDSIQRLTAQKQLSALQQKQDKSLATIQEKDDTIESKQYLIAGLGILAAILAAALAFTIILLLRSVVLVRKQRKAISIANEHNALKTKFTRWRN